MLLKGFGTYFFATAPTGQTFAEYLASLGTLQWLRVGEAMGTVASDSSGNANDGSYEGTFTLAQTGLVNDDSDTAVLLGSDGKVNLGDITVFENADTLGYDIRIVEKY